MNGAKRSFAVKLTFFKPHGKFYMDYELCINATDCGSREGDDGVLASPVCYMPEICDQIRQWWAEEELPGLGSGQWPGPILVTCDDGYPCLLLPRDEEDAEVESDKPLRPTDFTFDGEPVAWDQEYGWAVKTSQGIYFLTHTQGWWDWKRQEWGHGVPPGPGSDKRALRSLLSAHDEGYVVDGPMDRLKEMFRDVS